MKRNNSLNDLLMEELADLLNAENQWVEALPSMSEISQSTALKNTLKDCLEVAKEHVVRLQDIYSNIGQSPQKLTCKAMRELVTESKEMVNKIQKGPARDASIITTAQRAQEYEISRYKTAREHAIDLGHTRIVELFTKAINEERAINFYFNELTQGMINAQAINPTGIKQQTGGFYIPDRKFDKGGSKNKSKNTEVSRFIDEGNPNIQEPPTSNQGG